MPQSEVHPEAMRATLTRLLKREVAGLERIGGGRNSQVYKVETEGGQRVALKVYFRHQNDKRDRLATEYESFSYLWENGFREIPQPLVADRELGWAVYQFIEGEKIPAGQADRAAVWAAVDLLGRLRELSRKRESRRLGTASEAFFAPSLVVENVRQRLRHLSAPAAPDLENTAPYRALRRFLAEEFTPFLDHLAAWSKARLAAAGMAFDEELSWDYRTLSPSDCGFHNALRQPDGRIFFLDFEYFGWDDPAKMIADFLLHPAMELSVGLRTQFAAGMFRRFADWPGLVGRVAGVYPLFGLKWCMIVLNEFVPDQLLRRQFAATAALDRAAVQLGQLDKSRRMLQRIRQEYECFPYHD